jgi:hypothetical protein
VISEYCIGKKWMEVVVYEFEILFPTARGLPNNNQDFTAEFGWKSYAQSDVWA